MNTLNSMQVTSASKQTGVATVEMTSPDRSMLAFFDLFSEVSANLGSEGEPSDLSMQDIDLSLGQQENTAEIVEPRQGGDKDSEPGNSAPFAAQDADPARHLRGSIADRATEIGSNRGSYPETAPDFENEAATEGFDNVKGTTPSVQIAGSTVGSIKGSDVSTSTVGVNKTLSESEGGGDTSRNESLGMLPLGKTHPNRTHAGRTSGAFPGQELAVETTTSEPLEHSFDQLEANSLNIRHEQNQLPFPDQSATRPLLSENGLEASASAVFFEHQSGNSDLKINHNHGPSKPGFAATKTVETDRAHVFGQWHSSDHTDDDGGHDVQKNQTALSDQVVSGAGALNKQTASSPLNGNLRPAPASHVGASETVPSEAAVPKPLENQNVLAKEIKRHAVGIPAKAPPHANTQDLARRIHSADDTPLSPRLSASESPELSIAKRQGHRATDRQTNDVVPELADKAGQSDAMKVPGLIKEQGDQNSARTASAALDQSVAVKDTGQMAEKSLRGSNDSGRDRQLATGLKPFNGEHSLGSHDQPSEHVGNDPKSSNSSANLTILESRRDHRQVSSANGVQPQNIIDTSETVTNRGPASSDAGATVHMINLATSKAVVHSAQAWVNAPSSNSDEAAENLPSRQAPPPVSGLVRQEVEIAGTQLEISTSVAGQASKQLAPIAGGSSIEGLGAIIDDRASPEALIGATQLSSGLDGFAASGRVHALSGTTAGPPVLNTAQIAELIPSQPGQSVEIVLRPEELGRIRMTLVSSDGGMVLTVVADRAETLDLLRRNIADLGSELNRLGYDSVDFNFSQSRDDQDLPQNQPAPDDHAGPGSADVDDPAVPDPIVSGIDMRV